jgi:hypothetical protein
MKWISVAQKYPEDGERVLIFDARFGEAHVGWNAWQHRFGGGKSTPGNWIMPNGDCEDMHITHWAELPANPDA